MEDKEMKTEETVDTAPAEETKKQESGGKEKKPPRGKNAKLAALEEEVETLQGKLSAEREAHLRLAAEFDNFRKRSQKEKDASYTNGKADALSKLLPIYDNLDRALQQPTEDVAFKKGVELTMTELQKIFTALGVEMYGERGDAFDPNLHNAVMHIEDESLGENAISQVFQKGFKIGDKVVRFAMVQVAN